MNSEVVGVRCHLTAFSSTFTLIKQHIQNFDAYLLVVLNYTKYTEFFRVFSSVVPDNTV